MTKNSSSPCVSLKIILPIVTQLHKSIFYGDTRCPLQKNTNPPTTSTSNTAGKPSLQQITYCQHNNVKIHRQTPPQNRTANANKKNTKRRINYTRENPATQTPLGRNARGCKNKPEYSYGPNRKRLIQEGKCPQ